MDENECADGSACEVLGFIDHLPAVEVNRWDVLAFGLSWAYGVTQTTSSLIDAFSELAGSRAQAKRAREVTHMQMAKELEQILAGES